MDFTLDPVETRVLGCLVEKELATPEYYPLSLNALVNACNQKSNREPVMELAEADVSRALAGLGRKQLAIVAADGGRVPKHRHFLVEKLDLSRPALAILCELMLRGPQTPGELRTRASRMADFPDLAAVGTVLQQLEGEAPPLVACLPRQPGRKEQRYAQLFSGMPAADAPTERVFVAGQPDDGAASDPSATEARIAALEDEVARLKAELAELTRIVVG
jgi:uncharacterized protein YceH (UPF0502 family)